MSEPWREAPPLTSCCAVGRVVVGFLRGHRLRGWGPVAELEGAENANASIGEERKGSSCGIIRGRQRFFFS